MQRTEQRIRIGIILRKSLPTWWQEQFAGSNQDSEETVCETASSAPGLVGASTRTATIRVQSDLQGNLNPRIQEFCPTMLSNNAVRYNSWCGRCHPQPPEFRLQATAPASTDSTAIPASFIFFLLCRGVREPNNGSGMDHKMDHKWISFRS